MNNRLVKTTIDSLADEDDAVLLDAMAAGDTESFQRLVRRHAGRYIGLATRLLRRREDAEDVVQEAFIKLWLHPERFEKARGVRFATWFYRVVVNMCVDARRREKPVLSAEALPDVPDENGAEDEAALAKERLLLRAIQTLPFRQQAAVQLYYFDGLDQVTVAEVMNLKLKAFQSLLHRARSALRQQVLSDENDRREREDDDR